MPRPSIREILEALDFARVQAMYRGSPDFVRQREIENRVQALCTRMLRRNQPKTRRAASESQ